MRMELLKRMTRQRKMPMTPIIKQQIKIQHLRRGAVQIQKEQNLIPLTSVSSSLFSFNTRESFFPLVTNEEPCDAKSSIPEFSSSLSIPFRLLPFNITEPFLSFSSLVKTQSPSEAPISLLALAQNLKPFHLQALDHFL